MRYRVTVAALDPDTGEFGLEHRLYDGSSWEEAQQAYEKEKGDDLAVVRMYRNGELFYEHRGRGLS